MDDANASVASFSIREALFSLGLSGYITLFIVALSIGLSIFVSFILIKAVKNQDYSKLVTNDATGYLSQHKFWSNIAFLVATLAFIKVNFYGNDGSGSFITEIWIIYLSVIGGVDLFSSYMKHKKGNNQPQTPPPYDYGYGGSSYGNDDNEYLDQRKYGAIGRKVALDNNDDDYYPNAAYTEDDETDEVVKRP